MSETLELLTDTATRGQPIHVVIDSTEHPLTVTTYQHLAGDRRIAWFTLTYHHRSSSLEQTVSVLGTPEQLLQIAESIRSGLLCRDCGEALALWDGLCQECYDDREQRALVEPIDVRS